MAIVPTAARTARTKTPDTAPFEVDPQQHPRTLADCRRCPLWHDATQAVPGKGPRQAPIMMVGEQPGDKEDLAGEPFVGPAGALLDSALQDAGIKRGEVFVTNAVKHFKWEARGKRRMHKTPGQREMDACHYWLEQELASVAPKVIVALGATALKAVLQNSRATLQSQLGTVIEHEGRLVVPAYHPSFVLRAPDEPAKDQAYRVIVDALRRAGELVHDATR